MKNERLHRFTQKWIEKFKDINISAHELAGIQFAEDLREFNFEMDCGQAFSKLYGSAFNDVEELKKVIDQVDDISLLGSAVFSQWRYYNHWAMGGESIADPKVRQWFVLILERLATLAE